MLRRSFVKLVLSLPCLSIFNNDKKNSKPQYIKPKDIKHPIDYVISGDIGQLIHENPEDNISLYIDLYYEDKPVNGGKRYFVQEYEIDKDLYPLSENGYWKKKEINIKTRFVCSSSPVIVCDPNNSLVTISRLDGDNHCIWERKIILKRYIRNRTTSYLHSRKLLPLKYGRHNG